MADDQTLIAELQQYCCGNPRLCELDVARAFAALDPDCGEPRETLNTRGHDMRATDREIAWASEHVCVWTPTAADLELLHTTNNSLVQRKKIAVVSVEVLARMPRRFNTREYAETALITLHTARGRLLRLCKRNMVRQVGSGAQHHPSIWEKI